MSSRYTITELAALLNTTVERAVNRIALEGEISQITRAGSGHIYFTLKDEQAQLQAVMWRGTAARLTFRPDQGDQVLCVATANVYARSGRMQLIVHQMSPLGEGDLQKRFLALKEKLDKEGLFDVSRKRSLPFFPRRIGVVTSETGAVIHDIMVTLKERMPGLDVQLINVRVQGEGAKEEIAAAIKQFNTLQNVEVLIVGRGGGSLEDLWPFNEEIVVRAIFGSRIPVISSVGHESDVTLADLVADVRAATPTAAAERVVPHKRELLARLQELGRRLHERDRWMLPFMQRIDHCEMQLSHHFKRHLQTFRMMLQGSESRLHRVQPEHLLRQAQKDVQMLAQQLHRNILHRVERKQAELVGVQERVLRLQQHIPVQAHKDTLVRLERTLEQSVRRVVQHCTDTTAGLSSLLESMNPQRVLERGFAIVHHESKILRDVHTVDAGDVVAIRLSQGRIQAEVQSVHSDDQEVS